ncbi:DUF6048 family protein [Robiginitalea aurantiaca]|uniref:DUF6048 family protein n=1 Tax=Robiginitalea aurantiaca TaxID=3056915 RepID=A0ABT7WGD0_9FLAO|nr:DUF6048 family protein [Robiginitalea aurantiaca]MDM9631979.1 DUF6048 family protein [Robiginitalea aurantiaca]
MCRSFIKFSLLLALFCSYTGFGQKKVRDTTKKSEIYGLRVGIDLSRPLISVFKDGYQGLEIVGDYRLSNRWYLAAELGNESNVVEEVLDNADGNNRITIYEMNPSGSYIKLGADFNTYQNWFGMNNSIIVGARYAFSTFSTSLDKYSLFDSNRYWNPDTFPQGSGAYLGEYSGLNASWLELLLGVKTELFANIYLGASVRLGILVTDSGAGPFPNVWIPGFNKKTDNSRFGVGFNYSISYLIPLYRKSREKPVEITE